MKNSHNLQTKCTNHSTTQAFWICVKCQIPFCNSCIKKVPTHRGSHAQVCKLCGGFVRALTGQEQLIKPPSFLELVLDAFVFPIRGQGKYIIFWGAIVFAILRIMMAVPLIGIVIFILATGYMVAFMMRIVSHTADGKDDLPSWPYFDGFWDDVIVPFLLFVWVILFTFSPLWLLKLYGNESSLDSALPFVFEALGYFLLPMTILAVSIFKSFLVVSPHIIIPAIIRSFPQYGIALVALVFVYFIRVGIGYVLPDSNELIILLLWMLILSASSIYIIAVEMRIIGLIYRVNEKKLGWFDR